MNFCSKKIASEQLVFISGFRWWRCLVLFLISILRCEHVLKNHTNQKSLGGGRRSALLAHCQMGFPDFSHFSAIIILICRYVSKRFMFQVTNVYRDY